MKKLLRSLKFVETNFDKIQLLDLYLLAEHSFELATVSKSLTEQLIASQVFQGDGSQKITHRIVGNVIFIREKIPRDVKVIFSHRQCPIRNLYLLSRAIAFSMRDFANQFRAQAGLSPIPEEIFTQSEVFQTAIEINQVLPDIETILKQGNMVSYYKPMPEAERSAWLSDSLIFNNQSKKKPAPKKKQALKKSEKKASPPRSTRDIQPSSTKTTLETTLPSSSAGITNVLSTQTVLKKSLGARVYDELSVGKLVEPSVLKNFSNLFSRTENNLTHKQIDDINTAVIDALIRINKADRASKFMIRASDPRILAQGKNDKYLSKEALEYRLLPFVLADIIHPHFDNDNLLSEVPFLARRVKEEKMLLKGEDVDGELLYYAQYIRDQHEKTIEKYEPLKRRKLLIGLAHSWHKLSYALEVTHSGLAHKAATLKQMHNKIKALLHQAQPLISQHSEEPVSILEAYLFQYYLGVDLSPSYEPLTEDEMNQIEKRAVLALQGIKALPKKVVPVVDRTGTEISSYTVDNSIYHAITNNELGDYIVVKFDKPVKDRKIPLFIRYKDQIYRTDILGGSRLKPKSKKGDYGSLFAVPLRAGDYLKRWFTSEESFWYGQRAFMPARPNQTTKAASGMLNVALVPDSQRLHLLGNILAQDGFGAIKASKAEALQLEKSSTEKVTEPKSVAFQSIHGYASEGHRDAAQELFNGTISALTEKFDKLRAEDRANLLMGTLPKRAALGIPVDGDKVILSGKKEWREISENGVILGKNPYSAKRLQTVSPKEIDFSDELQNLKIIQTTLSGYYDLDKQIKGVFLKGLMLVIPDEKWPKEYADVDVIASSKDQKLNYNWLDKKTKDQDQNRHQLLRLVGVLAVKNEYLGTPLVGIPTRLAEAMAGDYDGDFYDVMPVKNYENLASYIAQESRKAIASPKIEKTFTPRSGMGNFSRILALRKPILGMWNGIMNRYYYLPEQDRIAFNNDLVKNHRLGGWLGADWNNKLGIRGVTNEDVVIAEIQLGLKYGEDAYKTNVDIESVLSRAREYESSLGKYHSDGQVPYGSALKKACEENAERKADWCGLSRPTSANLPHKVARAIGRYFLQTPSENGYVSDENE